MTALPEEPADQVENVEWHWLRPHLERGALILVAPGLALAEAGACVAADDAGRVGAWIASGELTKPTLEQINAWDAEPTRTFRMLIVQPYVLVQERPDATDDKE